MKHLQLAFENWETKLNKHKIIINNWICLNLILTYYYVTYSLIFRMQITFKLLSDNGF